MYKRQDRAVTIRDAKWQGEAITTTSTAGLGNTPIMLWLEAVSYTHLDVYKRQVKDEYGNEIELGYKSEIIGVTLKDNPDVVRGKSGKLILDVYKRQM